MSTHDILLATFTVDAELEREFNLWYNLEHIAPRIGLGQGEFPRCRRYMGSSGGARYVNLYDLGDGAIESDGYEALNASESKMPAVKMFADNFRVKNAATFRRIVGRHRESVGCGDLDRPANAISIEIVPGLGYDAMSRWTLSTLRGRLAQTSAVVSASLYDVDGAEPGFVLITQLDSRNLLDWTPFHAGFLGALPDEVLQSIPIGLEFGHLIGDFGEASDE